MYVYGLLKSKCEWVIIYEMMDDDTFLLQHAEQGYSNISP